MTPTDADWENLKVPQWISTIDPFPADWEPWSSSYGFFAESKFQLIASALYVVVVVCYKYIVEGGAKARGEKLARRPGPWAGIVHYIFLSLLSLYMFINFVAPIWAGCQAFGFSATFLGQGFTRPLRYSRLLGAADNIPGTFEDRISKVTFLFVGSKIVEFIDTGIQMYRRSTIMRLHWVHHFTVPILCAAHLSEGSMLMLTGGAWNCLVHTFMYAYYAHGEYMDIWVANKKAAILKKNPETDAKVLKKVRHSTYPFSRNVWAPSILLIQLSQFSSTLAHGFLLLAFVGDGLFAEGGPTFYQLYPWTNMFAWTIYAYYLVEFAIMGYRRFFKGTNVHTGENSKKKSVKKD